MDKKEEHSINGASMLETFFSDLDSSKLDYYNKILKDENVRAFLADKELVETVEQFFVNNLNVCQTSKKTFMHRNTLIYRLDKLVKMLGLDIRKFSDAVVLKMILMIVKFNEPQDFTNITQK